LRSLCGGCLFCVAHDMRDLHQGRLDSGLTCIKQWLPSMPKAAMTHSKLKALLLET
jgi:hypothetical protein